MHDGGRPHGAGVKLPQPGDWKAVADSQAVGGAMVPALLNTLS